MSIYVGEIQKQIIQSIQQTKEGEDKGTNMHIVKEYNKSI